MGGAAGAAKWPVSKLCAHARLGRQRGRRGRTGSGPQPAHVLQHLVEALAANELHGIVGGALTFADAEDRHNVGVVQFRRRLRLAAETLPVGGGEQRLRRQHLEGHVPPERLLLGFVDDTHAALSDLADRCDTRRTAPVRGRQRTLVELNAPVRSFAVGFSFST